MRPNLSRRRFLSISAALAALPSSALAGAPTARWRGVALGATASMTLAGYDQAPAEAAFKAVEKEIFRLENIFSLYREGSAVSRLNQAGRLTNPPPELLELLSLSDLVNRSTDGAFDPSVQPLWQLYAQSAANGVLPTAGEIQETKNRTGWKRLQYSPDAIRFDVGGMAVTFNGIAQGYIADKVADLLRSRGFTQVLIDMGEVYALGRKADGGQWQAGIASPENEILKRMPLENRALATSAPQGTVIDPRNRVGHILDPRSGQPAQSWKLVSISHEQACLADGLSTALCLLPRAEIERVLKAHPSAALEVLV